MKIETVKKVYNQAPSWYKEVLEDEFGKEKLIKREFTDFKTFDDVCRAFGTTEKEFNEKWNDLGLPNDIVLYQKLKMVAKSINDDWTPDWSDTNQAKYYPYFRVLPSGSGFSGSYAHYDFGATYVGSRLCFESSKKAEYAAKQFENLYTQFLLITK